MGAGMGARCASRRAALLSAALCSLTSGTQSTPASTDENGMVDALQWLSAMSPKPCANATLPHSPTHCEGLTGAECAYQCETGFQTVGARRCEPPANGSHEGQWTGGQCKPLTCPPVLTAHSATVCSGLTGDKCSLQCEAGYFPVGEHTCTPVAKVGPDGELQLVMQYVGGHCEPKECVADRPLHALTTCSGSLGTECMIECEPGYAAEGAHVCSVDEPQPTAAIAQPEYFPPRAHLAHPNASISFKGATCRLRRCPAAKIPHSVTLCEGTFGTRCFFSCETGYAATGVHTCAVNQSSVNSTSVSFDGGSCQPRQCPDAFPEHSSTQCTGGLGVSCELQCL
eukprot:SAG31_NODE_8405_length_1458_cov_1.195732_1_plen_340_part_10